MPLLRQFGKLAQGSSERRRGYGGTMRWPAAILLLLQCSALSAAESEPIVPLDSTALLGRAERALQKQSPAQAVALYSRALGGPALPQDDLVSSYNNRAIALRRMGQFARAAADYNRAIALAPEDPDLLFNRALALLPDGRFEEAVAELTTLLQVRPDDAQAIYLRGVAELGQSRPDRAIEDLTAAIALGVATPEAFYARGRAYATLRQHDLALDDFDAALAVSPDFGPALFGRGYSHSGLGQHELAVRDHSAAIALLPQDPAPYRGRADAYRRLGRFDLAIADYSRAIAIAPGDSASHGGRALARQRLGQYDPAIADFGEAIRLDPRGTTIAGTTAYKERGSLRFHLGQYSEAARDFQHSLRLIPHDAYAVLWLYLARQRSGIDGRAELADHAGRLALTRWPGPVVALFLGDASPSEVLKAMRHDDERRQRERECEAFFYLGEYHLLRGDVELAARFLRKSEMAGITNFMEYAGAKAELKKLAL